jgi:hypothetical protein
VCDDLRRTILGRSRKRGAGFEVVGEQRLHFPTKHLIGAANVVKIGGSRLGRNVNGSMENVLNPLPSVVVHIALRLGDCPKRVYRVSRRLADLTVGTRKKPPQPRLSKPEVPFYGGNCQAEGGRDFLAVHAAEIAHFDHLGLAFIHSRQPVEGLVDL